MSNPVNMEALSRRIRGLLNLANHPDTPEHEAAAAGARVQAMVEEYNLDLDNISTSHTDERGKEMHTSAAMYMYQRDLMKAVAEMNFCMWWVDEVYAESNGKTRKVKRHVLLGRKVNVVASKLLYDYLIGTMDRLLPYTGMDKRGKSALLWLEGCSDRLQARFMKARVQRELEAKRKAEEDKARAQHPSYAGNGTALTLVELVKNEYELNHDVMMDLPLGTTTALRLANQARAAERERVTKDKEIALMEEGISVEHAWYLARGYDIPTPRVEKPETEAQKRKREAREEKWRRSYRPDKRAQRKYSEEYQSGYEEGSNIGLNDQIKSEEKVKLS